MTNFSRRMRRELGPLITLVVSIATTTGMGARFMQNFHDGLPTIAVDSDLWPWPWLIAHPNRFLSGWPFSLALLAILLSHEFGHYLACRAHGVRSTLPWVLPAPTLSGTAGAVIRIGSRIPDRRALFDVGVYGPILGYLVSVIAVVIGFLLSRPAPAVATPELIAFGHPLTLKLIHLALIHIYPHTPPFELSIRHPVLIAGWIGLFMTSLNLVPGGQLDGGHILYSIWPKSHQFVAILLPAALLFCGFFYWLGWVVWGLILLLPVMRHPKVPDAPPLTPQRKLLACVALAIFVLSFTVQPFYSNSILYYLR